jgi:hypothetical protein
LNETATCAPELSPLRDFLRFAGNVIAGLWIFGGMGFFFLRFSVIFYYANKSAIDPLLSRWWH